MKTEGLSEITQGTDLHRSTPVAGLACVITRLLGWWLVVSAQVCPEADPETRIQMWKACWKSGLRQDGRGVSYCGRRPAVKDPCYVGLDVWGKPGGP